MSIKKIPYSLGARVANPNEEETEKKIYAVAQERGTMGIDELAEHMAEHTSSFSQGEIAGIIMDAVKCTIEHLKQGYAVELGRLGKFHVTISCDGAENAEDFNTGLIKHVNLRYRVGKLADADLQTAGFEQVASRELQLAARKQAREAANEAVGAETNNGNGNVNGNDNGEGITG